MTDKFPPLSELDRGLAAKPVEAAPAAPESVGEDAPSLWSRFRDYYTRAREAEEIEAEPP